MTSLNDITADLRRESFNQHGRKISSTDSVSNHFERLRTESVLCHPPPDVDANISGSASDVTFVLPE
uniref:Uncharacterized protein n=1 Tax=Romanomermis culicivorax TaxID=13658 RepID=A0A915KB73_ROMCU